MTESAVYLQPAFILQHRKYRESSLIIDALTRDFGRVSLLAKGVRKAKSKTAGLLQPFIPLLISYFGKAELKTLTDVELHAHSRHARGIQATVEDRGADLRPASSIPEDSRAGSRSASDIHSIHGDTIQPLGKIKGLALYCGFYVNELIGYFLHKYDPHPEVFEHYRKCLSCLSGGVNIEAALREFELDLLQAVGYGLPLEYDDNDNPIESSKKYDFNVGQGAVEALNGQFSGKTLQAFNSRELNDPQVLNEAKILMRMVIDVYLQGKQLKSRAFISEIIKHTSVERDL